MARQLLKQVCSSSPERESLWQKEYEESAGSTISQSLTPGVRVHLGLCPTDSGGRQFPCTAHLPSRKRDCPPGYRRKSRACRIPRPEGNPSYHEKESDIFAFVNGTAIQEGTIDVDIAVKITTPPGVRMSGFTGIAFQQEETAVGGRLFIA